MSTFFRQTAQAMIAKHIDRFPLLKLDQVIDWQPIEQYLNRQRTRYLRDHRGRPAYPLLSMFKAVLLGQWHSLSDPELEHSLITRIDFNLFCRFDELSIPDYSTLCRYRNWLAQDDTLSELPELINRQLTEKNLKIEKASAAVVDATIIQTETFAKFLSFPTAETQTQVFSYFRPKYLLILPQYPLNPPRIPDNQASGLPFRRQRAHLACWRLSTGSNTSP
ncbi:transposase, partial [Neisseria meningitidis]|uniref:transposase n=2 Tax=Neisseria meningitidis TaxID=487 RepID=UPI00037010C5